MTPAVLAALAVELVDELFDGARSGAMPLIRHDLALDYVQIGLLGTVPLIVGSILELPAGVLGGTGSRRRRFILAGGLAFAAAILAAGLARSFAVLLIALTAFFPASGAFVGLTEATLMDADPGRRPQSMARWTLAGSIGAVGGPLLLTAILAAGGTWRLAFILIAALALIAWVATTLQRNAAGKTAELEEDSGSGDSGSAWPGWAAATAIVRQCGALRWLVLLQTSDLLLDVFTAFLAVYLVVAAHASAAVAALAVAVRYGANLAGDVLLVRLLERRDSSAVLRVGSLTALLAFPAFLLAPGIGPKLAALAVLTVATAPWYPVLNARLYASLPGHSGLAVSLTSAASLAGGLGPLAVGLLAQHLGIGWAMAVLSVVPPVVLVGCGARGHD